MSGCNFAPPDDVIGAADASTSVPLLKNERLKLAKALARMPADKRQRLIELEAKRRGICLPLSDQA